MYDDLLINGTSLKTFGHIASYAGIFADAPLRGENVTIPGRAGEVFVPKVRGAYVFTVPLVILGGWDTVNEALDDLRTLLDTSSAAFTMTRNRTVGAGTVSQTALGDYLGGLEPQLVGMTAGRVALDLINLDGGWT